MYKNLKVRNTFWYCKECIQEIPPFCSKKVNPNNSEHQVLTLISNIFFCQLNNLSEEETNDNENLHNCKYRDVSYFTNLDMKLKMSLTFPS